MEPQKRKTINRTVAIAAVCIFAVMIILALFDILPTQLWNILYPISVLLLIGAASYVSVVPKMTNRQILVMIGVMVAGGGIAALIGWVAWNLGGTNIIRIWAIFAMLVAIIYILAFRNRPVIRGAADEDKIQTE